MVRGYRLGTQCRSEPWAVDGVEAEPIAIRPAGGVWIQDTAERMIRVYSEAHTVGFGVHTAAVLGLCHVLPAEEVETQQRYGMREHRAAETDRQEFLARRVLSAVAGAAQRGDALALAVQQPSFTDLLEAIAEHFERAGR